MAEAGNPKYTKFGDPIATTFFTNWGKAQRERDSEIDRETDRH